MERSRLPLPSLLGLFAVLLMLSPELLMGIAGKVFELPATDPEVQQVLTFAMEQYNKDTGDTTNYFKLLRLVKLLREVFVQSVYYLMVELVETICVKKAGMIMIYENFQKCPLRPKNPKKQICFFKVAQVTSLRLDLAVTLCI